MASRQNLKADFVTGKKEEPDEVAKVKYGETEDAARRYMQQMKLKEEGIKGDEAKQRAERETAVDRGIAGRSTIFESMGSVTDAIKEKFTMPSDIVRESRAAAQQQHEQHPKSRGSGGGGGGEKTGAAALEEREDVAREEALMTTD